MPGGVSTICKTLQIDDFWNWPWQTRPNEIERISKANSFTMIKRLWINYMLIVSWWYNDLSEICFPKFTMRRSFFTKLNISSSKLNSRIMIKIIWDRGKWSNREGGYRSLSYLFKLWYLAKNIQFTPLWPVTPLFEPS